MKTTAVFFPFDLFGSPGASAGADLLADAFDEMLADNSRERRPTRARAYQQHVRVRKFQFDRLEKLHDWREQACAEIRRRWDRGDFLLWIAGNHLGVLPIYDELAGRDGTLVVQFDAHLDVYNLSDCTSELSHGNWLLHCQRPLPKIINVGTRELLLPARHVRRYYCEVYSASAAAVDSAAVTAALRRAADRADRVVIDLDCDVLDPAYFPAVAHSQPFGLSPQALLQFLDPLCGPKLVGFALSEFDPGRDVADRCLATLVWLLEFVLLRKYEKRKARTTGR